MHYLPRRFPRTILAAMTMPADPPTEKDAA
jgi:hypothetical protein